MGEIRGRISIEFLAQMALAEEHLASSHFRLLDATVDHQMALAALTRAEGRLDFKWAGAR